MSIVHGTGGIDETHGGLQKLYFVADILVLELSPLSQ
jgi:hypothetical protein